MINGGSHEIFIDEDNGWTTFSADRSLSAQWEHTILVTEDTFEYVVTSKPISLDMGLLVDEFNTMYIVLNWTKTFKALITLSLLKYINDIQHNSKFKFNIMHSLV